LERYSRPQSAASDKKGSVLFGFLTSIK